MDVLQRLWQCVQCEFKFTHRCMPEIIFVFKLFIGIIVQIFIGIGQCFGANQLRFGYLNSGRSYRKCSKILLSGEIIKETQNAAEDSVSDYGLHIPTSVSDNVTERATAVTTFSAGIIAAKSNCSAIVSTVAVIICKKECCNLYF